MHNKRTPKEKKKKTKKQIVFQIIAIVLIVAAGIGSGFYCGMLYLSSKIPKVNYAAYSEELLRPNIDEVKARTNGKNLSEVSAVDAFVLAEYNVENCEQYISTSSSTLTHNFGKQSVYAYKHKYNGQILKKEISTSSMKSYAQMIKYNGEEIHLYGGTPSGAGSAEWSDKYNSYTVENYKNEFGTSPLEIVPFIVSEKTISNADQTAKEVGKGIRQANGNYRFSLSLDTKSSVINYVKQIKVASSIANYPTFLQLDLVFEVTPDFKFVSITSIEMYSFSYSGIAVTCSGNITTYYDYTTIPTEV